MRSRQDITLEQIVYSVCITISSTNLRCCLAPSVGVVFLRPRRTSIRRVSRAAPHLHAHHTLLLRLLIDVLTCSYVVVVSW